MQVTHLKQRSGHIKGLQAKIFFSRLGEQVLK
jgi:hypothetical protein